MRDFAGLVGTIGAEALSGLLEGLGGMAGACWGGTAAVDMMGELSGVGQDG